MADWIDEAQDLNEEHIKRSLKEHQARIKNPVPFSGLCLCCGEPVSERRFCDSDCRELFEQRALRRR